MHHTCPFCGTSIEAHNLKSHIETTHKNDTIECFRCCHCEIRVYNDVHSYYKHLNLKHSADPASGSNCLPDESHPSSSFSDQIAQPQILTLSQTENLHGILGRNIFKRKFINGLTNTSELNSNLTLPPADYKKFGEQITSAITKFTLHLYAAQTIPRSTANVIVNKTAELHNLILEEISQQWRCADCQTKLRSLINIIQSNFNGFKTTHRVVTTFEKLDYLIQPITTVISYTTGRRKNNKKIKLTMKEVKIEIIPMEATLIQFLELPEVFKSIINNIKKCQMSEMIVSPVQGILWKTIEEKFSGKIVLPLVISFDDLEINNALGSHKNIHKLGAMYFTIIGIPNEFKGVLENIFLLQLHNTEDFKTTSHSVLFANIIDQLKDLETRGIWINYEGTKIQIFFVLLSIIGDNLGQHQILGFKCSFNTEFCCRLCLGSKQVRKTQFKEDETLLRVNNNHKNDLESKSHDVLRRCAFDDLKYFDGITNISVDSMHDLLEGVLRYFMALILFRFIYVYKFFSLRLLNERIRFFLYQKGTNIPPPIKEKAIKKDKNLVLTASEMKVLLMNLGFYIGDKVPINNSEWKCFLLLREITRIIMSNSLHARDVCRLTDLIYEFLKLFENLFPESWKPKFHHLIHYPRLIRFLGLLVFFSSMRYEGKHGVLKNAANSTKSRVNPAHTVAINHQLIVSNRFLNNEGFSARICCGQLVAEALRDLPDFVDFSNIIPLILANRHIVPAWISVHGTLYETDMYLTLKIISDEDHLFGKIKYISVTTDERIFLIYQDMTTISLSSHLQGLQVADTDVWGCIAQSDLIQHKPNYKHVLADGQEYILRF